MTPPPGHRAPGVEIDLPRAFKVRRFKLSMPLSTIEELTEEIVWAHSYSPVDGALIFVTLRQREIRVIDEHGNLDVQQGVAQHYTRTMAPGTWYDVAEELIPQAKPGALVN